MLVTATMLQLADKQFIPEPIQALPAGLANSKLYRYCKHKRQKIFKRLRKVNLGFYFSYKYCTTKLFQTSSLHLIENDKDGSVLGWLAWQSMFKGVFSRRMVQAEDMKCDGDSISG